MCGQVSVLAYYLKAMVAHFCYDVMSVMSCRITSTGVNVGLSVKK